MRLETITEGVGAPPERANGSMPPNSGSEWCHENRATSPCPSKSATERSSRQDPHCSNQTVPVISESSNTPPPPSTLKNPASSSVVGWLTGSAWIAWAALSHRCWSVRTVVPPPRVPFTSGGQWSNGSSSTSICACAGASGVVCPAPG